MRPIVLLFDVDGTLVSTGGAGRRALERAFAAHRVRPDVLDGMSFGGLTDWNIVRAGLRIAGQAGDAAAIATAIDGILTTYVAALEDEVARAPGYQVHRGVERALDAVLARADVATGLGTGNIREGARVKLARGGLFERFCFGGFGCDHEDRAELLAIGAARGAAQLGVDSSACRVVVVGDTPRDVAAARAIGAESVAVGTSQFTPTELLGAGASCAFRDLTEPGALEALLG